MRWYIVIVLAGTLLTACSEAPAPANTPGPDASPAATPSPDSSAPVPTYPEPAYPEPAYPEPAAITSGYPAPTEIPPQGPEFNINTPVNASDIQVTGTGPADVPVRLIDLTKGGEILGETTINSDNTFTFDVGEEMQAGDRIGLILGTVEGTAFTREDFLRGPGYVDMPFVGVVFDMTIVE